MSKRSGRSEGDAQRPHAFRAFRHPLFRRYFAGEVASISGTFLQQTALGWLVFRETGSAADLGLVLAAGSLPTLLFGPWGGALADRVDLRRLLLCTQILFGLLATGLWVAAALHVAPIGVLVGVSVAGGVVQVVDSPARQVFVASLVPPDDVASAMSMNGVIVNSARVVGPALAGVLIATVGTTPCFAINALSYLAVIGALASIPARVTSRTKGTGGVREGIRYARGRQQLWLPLAMMALVGLLAFNFGVVLPVFAKDTLHGGGGTYGLLTAVLSAGSVVGSFSVGLIRHPRRIYLASAATAFGLGMVATAEARSLALASVALAFTGLAAFAFVTMTSTTLQLHAAPSYRARIMALFGLFYLGTTPIGTTLAGWVSGAAGAPAALLMGAGACFVAAVLAFLVRTPPRPDAALVDLAPTASHL